MSKLFNMYRIIILLFASLVFMPGCWNDPNNTKGFPFLGSPGSLSNEIVGLGPNDIPAGSGGDVYLIGAGIHDITGPAAEVGMQGFAVSGQKTSGISMRLRARAFVIGDGNKRLVFVSSDLWGISQMIKIKVCQKIAQNPALSQYYNEKNVLLSATHTHSGPGGFSGYFLYDVTVNGFIWQNFNAIVDGIYQSILKAHNNAQAGRIYYNQGTLSDCGGNRSQFAYDNNPLDERNRYDGSTDKTFTLLKFVALNGQELGMLNWYAVHPTSIGPDNTLISGDNKGYAAYLFEKDKGANYLADRTFVAAFAQTNAGDVSPNIGFGLAPANTDLARNPSLRNAVMKQYNKAKELYDGATQPLAGPIDSRHEYVDMRSLEVADAGCATCASAMGASFSAGSPADNPSPAPLFPSGTTVDSENWSEDAASAFLNSFFGGVFAAFWPQTQDPAYKACHAEKPILIPTGKAGINLSGIPMVPQIMPLQILKIGNLAIAAVPDEVTTMSGRRIKDTILSSLGSIGVDHAVVAGLSNAYSSYLATREEYAKQAYEGACTQYGPNELAAYQQEFQKLGLAMVNGAAVEAGPAPRDLSGDVVNLNTGVVFDDKPLFNNFGDVITQPNSSYSRGALVTALFWGAHPNNNLRTQDTYLVIEKLAAGSWVAVARDWDPETAYRWQRDGIANSKVTVTWDTTNAAPGTYRIRQKGNWKSGWTGKISPYEGLTRTFTVN